MTLILDPMRRVLLLVAFATGCAYQAPPTAPTVLPPRQAPPNNDVGTIINPPVTVPDRLTIAQITTTVSTSDPVTLRVVSDSVNPWTAIAVEWGDGAREASPVGVTEAVWTHRYRSDGVYVVGVAGAFASGPAERRGVHVLVLPPSPLIVHLYAPDPVTVGRPTLFSASATKDGPLIGSASYEWLVGPVAGGPGKKHTTSTNHVTHTFTAAGTYTVQALVRSGGHSGSDHATVTVVE